MKTIILTILITLLVLGLVGETAYIIHMKSTYKSPEKILAAMPRSQQQPIVINRHPARFDEDYQAANEWDPFAEMDRIQSQMNRMFRSSLSRGMLTQPGLTARNAFYEPDIDLEETETAYIAKIDLPGMDKDKISIQVKEGMLIISGERNVEREETKGDQFYSKERSFGSFSRVIPLPSDAKSDGMTAEYNKGVLVVKIPRESKTQTEEKNVTKIQVK